MLIPLPDLQTTASKKHIINESKNVLEGPKNRHEQVKEKKSVNLKTAQLELTSLSCRRKKNEVNKNLRKI